MTLTAQDQQFLRNVPLLGDFGPDEIAEIAEFIDAVEYDTGEMIIWGRTPNRSLFILGSGTAAVTVVVRGEHESVLAHLYPGAHFGELTLIDGMPAAGSVIAEEPCRVYVVPLANLQALMAQKSPLYGKLTWAMLRDLALKLRATNEKVLEAVTWGLDAADPEGD